MDASRLTIEHDGDGAWQLKDADRVIGGYATNADAWKAYDKLIGEPISKAEDRTDWFVETVLNSWP